MGQGYESGLEFSLLSRQKLVASAWKLGWGLNSCSSPVDVGVQLSRELQEPVTLLQGQSGGQGFTQRGKATAFSWEAEMPWEAG